MRFPRVISKNALAVALSMAVAGALAMPAADIIVQLQQPGGGAFDAQAMGDEWNNRMETTKGFTVAQDASGIWRYVADYGPGKAPVLSPVRAENPAPPGLTKHISAPGSRPRGASGEGTSSTSASGPSSALAVSTSSSVLFILARFNDQAGTTGEASWASFVSNNVVDYYVSTSHGNANLVPAIETGNPTSNDGVVGWVNLEYDHPNTAGNTSDTNRKLAADAIAKADAVVDFATYDINGNGFVDGDELSIVVIVAGYETAYGGDGPGGALSPSVWGHKWGWWSTVGANPYPLVDGVRITEYAQFGELHASGNSSQHQATMGIMVHELGHLTYGLPDLYDTDGSSSGIGAFGVMASGSWGRASGEWAGETPVNASAWTKYALNWVDGMEGSSGTSIEASGSGTATAGNTVFRASTGVSNQYFLIENRQQQGYDTGLYRWLGNSFGGLAIWHVDDSRTSNSNDSNRLTDLEEADGTQMGKSSGSASDLWSDVNGEAFGPNSNPDSDLYNGTASGVAVGNISASGTTMLADIGAPEPPPDMPNAPSPPPTVDDNRDGSATISWGHDGNNLTGFGLVRQKAHKKRPNVWTETVALDPVAAAAGDTLWSIADISGAGTFRWGVRAVNGSAASDWAYSGNTTITDDSGGGGGEPLSCPVELRPAGGSCTSNAQCCSDKCKGKPGSKTCN